MSVRYPTFQFRRDLQSQWTLKNPTLLAGEVGYEADTGRLKVGDGVLPWVSLPYLDGVGAIVDGDRGDITVSGNGDVWTIDAGSVTYPKMQAVSTTDRILGRSSAGGGVIEEIVCTAAGRDLLDDADAAAQLVTLGAAASDHTHSLYDLSNVEFIGPVADNSVLIYSSSSDKWGAGIGVGGVPVGALPIPTGWPSGSVGGELALRAPKADPTFTGVAEFADGAVGAPAITFSESTTGLWSPQSDQIALSLLGTQRALLHRNPNNSNQTEFTISGPTRAIQYLEGGVDGGTVGAFAFRNASSTTMALVYGTTTGTNTDAAGAILFETKPLNEDIQERMIIRSDGRVGIAITNPSSTLHVSGIVTVAAGDESAPSITPEGDSNTGVFFDTDAVAITTGGSERLRVTAAGSVLLAPLAADPASPSEGETYYSSALRRVRVYDGVQWVSLGVAGMAWKVGAASYFQSFSVAAKDTAPQGVFFKPDGLAMYIVGNSSDSVHEYSLDIPWDISTASFAQTFSVAAQETTPTSVFFKPDGTKMYVAGDSGNDINEYSLSSAWDISSASYVQAFAVGGQESQVAGIFFRQDGEKMYMTGTNSANINEYDLSSAWDVSTASYSQALSVGGTEGTPSGIFFRPDGKRMYVSGGTGDAVYEYALSTAWDVSTATLTTSRSVLAQDNDVRCVFFRPDGLAMYVVGVQSDQVHQYLLA